jgi:hypothetical protein
MINNIQKAYPIFLTIYIIGILFSDYTNYYVNDIEVINYIPFNFFNIPYFSLQFNQFPLISISFNFVVIIGGYAILNLLCHGENQIDSFEIETFESGKDLLYWNYTYLFVIIMCFLNRISRLILFNNGYEFKLNFIYNYTGVLDTLNLVMLAISIVILVIFKYKSIKYSCNKESKSYIYLFGLTIINLMVVITYITLGVILY